MGFVSFLPFLALVAWVSHFMAISHRIISEGHFQQQEKISALLFNHYTPSVILMSLAMLTAFSVLVYFAFHIARIMTMNSGTKMGWIVFLMVFNFIAFPIFWFVEIRKEPFNLPMYPSIE